MNFAVDILVYIIIFVVIFVGVFIPMYLCYGMLKRANVRKKFLNEHKEEYKELERLYNVRLEAYKQSKFNKDYPAISFAIIDNKFCSLPKLQPLIYYAHSYAFINTEYLNYMKHRQLPDKSLNEKIEDLKNVKYFKQAGSIHTEQYNIGGSNAKTNCKEVDDRITEIVWNNGNLEVYDTWVYDWLIEIIPEKEYNNFAENSNRISSEADVKQVDDSKTGYNEVYTANIDTAFYKE